MISVLNIIVMFIVLAILAYVIFIFTGVNVQSTEAFTFCAPDDCACVCERNEYQKYCDSPYLKDGPEALCNCKWDKASRMCVGTRAHNVKCRL